jgi:hypothetical protein
MGDSSSRDGDDLGGDFLDLLLFLKMVRDLKGRHEKRVRAASNAVKEGNIDVTKGAPS